MRVIDRRAALALLGTSALTACAAPSIVTREDRDPFEGGIGGTGIIGVVTALGSLQVNGLFVDVTSETSVASALGPMTPADVQPGMAVTIFANRSEDGLRARRVSVDYTAIGTAERGRSGRLEVAGVPVIAEPGALGTAEIGERVAVSGVWGPAAIVASRFDPAPEGPDLIAGTVTRGDPARFGIGSVPVRGIARLPRRGGYAVALGQSDERGFRARELMEGRFGASDRLRLLSVDGFLEPVAALPGFRIAGLGHSFDRQVRLQRLASNRALYFGRYTGLFRAQAGYVVPESFAERRAALAGGIQAFNGPVIETV